MPNFVNFYPFCLILAIKEPKKSKQNNSIISEALLN